VQIVRREVEIPGIVEIRIDLGPTLFPFLESCALEDRHAGVQLEQGATQAEAGRRLRFVVVPDDVPERTRLGGSRAAVSCSISLMICWSRSLGGQCRRPVSATHSLAASRSAMRSAHRPTRVIVSVATTRAFARQSTARFGCD
jgi:hypothetical protein